MFRSRQYWAEVSLNGREKGSCRLAFESQSILRQNLDDAGPALRISVKLARKLQVFDRVSGGGSGDASCGFTSWPLVTILATVSSRLRDSTCTESFSGIPIPLAAPALGRVQCLSRAMVRVEL